MRKIMLSAVLAVTFAVPPVVAQTPTKPGADKSSASKPAAGAPGVKQIKRNPCAEYGAGFVQVQGSDTCVRIGGAVGVDVGISR